MKKLITSFFLLFLLSVSAQKDIQISLLTSKPGDLPHTLFGHSALRITIPEDDFDKIYNYGLFKFNTPNFGLKFLGGSLEYWLGRQTVDGFISVNNRERRLIKEQVLNLSQEQAASIYKKVSERHESEDRFYRYSFTSKNCTSEIRDLLTEYGIITTEGECSLTYSDILEPYTTNSPWFDFSILLITGTEMHRTINYEESLFLPADLEKAVQETPGLVLENNELNSPDPPKESTFLMHLVRPVVIFSLLTLFLFFWSPQWIRMTLYFIIGGFGTFVLYMWLTTLHPEIQNNFNVLWCNPLYLLLFLIQLFKKQLKWLNYLILGMIGVGLIVWILQVQVFHWAVLPIMIMMTLLNLKELRVSQ